MTDPAAVRPPLDLPRLAAVPSGERLMYDVDVVGEAGSTNVLVAERARAGAPEGLVVVAEHQTAGRGRLDRTWETPARAALTFSVLLRPAIAAARWPWLPLLTGVAVQDAIGRQATLKWPNDVLIGDRKVAGLLAERVETPTGAAAVLGIGINVSSTAAELPVPTATSLVLEGHDVDRTDLLLAVLARLDHHYATWSAGREQDRVLQTTYAERCSTLGRQVRVDLPSGESVTGTAVEIDLDGRLAVEAAGGRVVVGAGDVIHVRTAQDDAQQ